MIDKACYTAVPLGHDRTTICEIAVRSYHGRGDVFKIVMSVANFEHVQNNRGVVVAKSCRFRSVVRAH